MPACDKKTGNPIVDPTSGLPKLVPVWEQDLSKPKKMPNNAEPIREGVAVITESTTMEQMKTLGLSNRAALGNQDKSLSMRILMKDMSIW